MIDHAKSISSMEDNMWLLEPSRFAALTGFRRKEVCFLEWQCVDLKHRTASVIHTDRFTPKWGIERTIPIIDGVHEILSRQKERGTHEGRRSFVFRGANGGQLNDEYWSERFRFYRRKAGLPEEIHLHSLRHTFASWWVQEGGDLYRLKTWLGHKSIKTTERYAHLKQESLRKEAARLFSGGRLGALQSAMQKTPN